MAIPIIGQPRINDWFLTIQLTCPCGENLMMIGQVGTQRRCKCGKVFALMGWPTPTPEGELDVPLGMRMTPPPPPPPNDTVRKP